VFFRGSNSEPPQTRQPKVGPVLIGWLRGLTTNPRPFGSPVSGSRPETILLAFSPENWTNPSGCRELHAILGGVCHHILQAYLEGGLAIVYRVLG